MPRWPNCRLAPAVKLLRVSVACQSPSVLLVLCGALAAVVVKPTPPRCWSQSPITDAPALCLGVPGLACWKGKRLHGWSVAGRPGTSPAANPARNGGSVTPAESRGNAGEIGSPRYRRTGTRPPAKRALPARPVPFRPAASAGSPPVFQTSGATPRSSAVSGRVCGQEPRKHGSCAR